MSGFQHDQWVEQEFAKADRLLLGTTPSIADVKAAVKIYSKLISEQNRKELTTVVRRIIVDSLNGFALCKKYLNDEEDLNAKMKKIY